MGPRANPELSFNPCGGSCWQCGAVLVQTCLFSWQWRVALSTLCRSACWCKHRLWYLSVHCQFDGVGHLWGKHHKNMHMFLFGTGLY